MPRLRGPGRVHLREALPLELREQKIQRRIEDGRQGMLRIYLKYDPVDGSSIIEGLQRVSTPGRRCYVGKDAIPRVRGGLGTAILSTPQGVLTDKEARRAGVGGEVLARVW